MQKIINNRRIEIYPKEIYKWFLAFGLICMIIGFFTCYTIYNYYMYSSLENLIINNGILIFDDKYYRFIETTPNLNYILNN